MFCRIFTGNSFKRRRYGIVLGQSAAFGRVETQPIHFQGLENLLKFGNLQKIFETLSLAKCDDERESLSLKAALWTLGHLSTSTEGVELLSDPASHVYEKIIHLAKHCDVYSVRATALHVLGLVGSTKAGANVLFKYGKRILARRSRCILTGFDSLQIGCAFATIATHFGPYARAKIGSRST